VLAGLEAGESFAVSSDNRRMVYTRRATFSNLWLVDRRSGEPQASALTTGTLRHACPAISPDGRTIAFARGTASRSEIFTMPIDGGRPRQLTFLDAASSCPVWSPEGERIAFASDKGGTPRVWRVDVGGGTPRPFERTHRSAESGLLVWMADGRILYHRPGNRNFVILDPETEEETTLIEDDSFGWIFSPHASPDGTRVAVKCNCNPGGLGPEDGIWVVETDSGSRVHLLHGEQQTPVGWSADGRRVYVIDYGGESPELLTLPAEGGDPEPVADLPTGAIRLSAMTADASRLVGTMSETRSDVWLVESFDPDLQ
jgi:Tol biopolymer transport system component